MVHRGEIDHDTRARPVESHGRLPVEHSPQRPVQQLAERERRRFPGPREVVRVDPGNRDHLSWRSSHHPCEVGEGHIVDRPHQMRDRVGDERVLARRQVTAQDTSEQRRDHRRLPSGSFFGITRATVLSGIERVDAPGSARMEIDHREAERVGQLAVLALRIGDRYPSTEHRHGPVDERLGRRALPDADVTGEQHVRVRDRTAGVRLERVEREPTAPRQKIRAQVDAPVPETRLRGERIGRAQVRGRRTMPW